MPRPVVRLLIALAVLWHVLATLAPGWVLTGAKKSNGRDFASFYYAVQVATEGGDPYDKRALGAAARETGARSAVHPFFYPPPFLLAMTWAAPLELLEAYRVWFWLDELAAIAAMLALWGWWRGQGREEVAVLIALAFALMTAVPNNHIMGQMNFPALALAIGGLWAVDRGHKVPGGVLLGIACMWKMSPALLVAWWLLRREWVAVGAAIGAAVLLTLAALPVVSWEHQLRFYTEVLPKFGNGDYNGLAVPISLFGNHSVPNLWNEVARGPGALSPVARALSTLTTLALLTGLALAFRRPPADALQQSAQVGAVGLTMLLIPVYTYEHHLVWALPAVVALGLAWQAGRLHPSWLWPLALALAVWAYDLQALKQLRGRWDWLPMMAVIQELKFGSLVVLFSASVWVGARPPVGDGFLPEDGHPS